MKKSLLALAVSALFFNASQSLAKADVEVVWDNPKSLLTFNQPISHAQNLESKPLLSLKST